MAVDETLVESVLAGGRPTVRLYGFEPAALSLGRNQRSSDSHDPEYLRLHGIDLVRRPTGGLAVLHEHERTYSIAGRLDRPPFDRGVLATYGAIAAAIACALGALGVPARIPVVGSRLGAAGPSSRVACFATPTTHEIVARGRKLVGSAQLRRRSVFLQHGSILLRGDPDRLARAVGAAVPWSFTDLERELGHPVDGTALDRALIERLADLVGAELEHGDLDATERARATRLRELKYESAAWTLD